MRNITNYIESGILELYLSGSLSNEEGAEVEKMIAGNLEIQAEFDSISHALEQYAQLHAIEPNPVVKPFLMAIIDFTERMKNGEPATFPPVLHEAASINDYAPWLNRADMQLPENFQQFYAKIIGYTPQAITAIVWIEQMAPQEVHDDEHEKFLILEGACNIIVDEKIYPLIPGDYFAIPLHKNHRVEVTSAIPCKVILQRVAA